MASSERSEWTRQRATAETTARSVGLNSGVAHLRSFPGTFVWHAWSLGYRRPTGGRRARAVRSEPREARAVPHPPREDLSEALCEAVREDVRRYLYSSCGCGSMRKHEDSSLDLLTINRL